MNGYVYFAVARQSLGILHGIPEQNDLLDLSPASVNEPPFQTFNPAT